MLEFIPIPFKYCFMLLDMNPDPLSEGIFPGVTKVEKILFKHLVAVSVEVSLHGNANGNLLNSSTIVRINRFSENVNLGNGPLKSTDMR